MGHLSISEAWEETRVLLKRDGRLLSIVALALIAVPTAIMGAVSPRGLAEGSHSIGGDLVALIGSLLAVAGQLALIRLALTPGQTVGSAIVHGIRRTPVFLLALILVVIGLFIAAVPFGAILAVAGVPLSKTAEASYNPLTLVAVLLYIALIIFIGVRLIMAAPVASAEPVGIIGVLRRTWQLTSGHWWRLLGFLIMFFFGMLIVLLAVTALTGVVAEMAFGTPDPLSASALVIALVQGVLNAVVTLVFVLMSARLYAQLAGSGEAQVSVPSSGT